MVTLRKISFENKELGSIVQIKGGKRLPKGESFSLKETPYRYIRISDMDKMGIDSGSVKYISRRLFNLLKNYQVSEKDLYLSIAGTIGRVGEIPGELDGAILTENAVKLVLGDNIDKNYLTLFLNSDFTKKQIIDLTRKMGQPKLAIFRAKQIKVKIPYKNGKPSLKEQKRIVNAIEKVHLLLDKSEREIKDVDGLINSICKQEFEKNTNSSNPAKLDDICNITKGQFPTLKTLGGKYTFVVTAEKRKSANDFQFNEEAVCVPLVSSTGHGHASMHRIHYEKGKFALANIMVALTPKDKKKVNTKYLYYYLSYYKDKLFVSLMRGGANVTIPLYKLSDVKISIPKIKEQEKLVFTMAKVEELKQKLFKKQSLINQLFQSTLNYAFQGKL